MQKTGRILTVALNPAVDITYLVERLTPGADHRVLQVDRYAGGKANNVARVVTTLGHRAVATGFIGGQSGRFLADSLGRSGVETAFLPVNGESRSCVIVVDRQSGTHSLFREPGPAVTVADLDQFRAHFRRLIAGFDFAVLSGSLPPGAPDDLYGELVAIAWRTGQVRTIVDASGAALQGSLGAQPYLVKPNREELTEWAGRPLTDEADLLAAAHAMAEAGALVVAVSLGGDGLLLVSPEGCWRAVPPAITPLNTVGSGDSAVAGLLTGLCEGGSAESILARAVACGTANALTLGVADPDPASIARLLRQVRVERL